MRSDVKQGDGLRAVVKAIEATFDGSKWMDLERGLQTDTLDYIQHHPRLLRSLDWGDPDYLGCVIEAAPIVLGEGRDWDHPGGRTTFKNLAIVEQQHPRRRDQPTATDRQHPTRGPCHG